MMRTNDHITDLDAIELSSERLELQFEIGDWQKCTTIR